MRAHKTPQQGGSYPSPAENTLLDHKREAICEEDTRLLHGVSQI